MSEIIESKFTFVKYLFLFKINLCKNCAAVVEYCKQIGPGHTIVTILCDYGTRYFSKG